MVNKNKGLDFYGEGIKIWWGAPLWGQFGHLLTDTGDPHNPIMEKPDKLGEWGRMA